MAGFGGLCPLPLRLGGTRAETAWTASDQSAVCRDLVAVARVLPFAHVVTDRDGAVLRYRGVNGLSSEHHPVVTAEDVGPLRFLHFVFPAEWEDSLGLRRSVNIKTAEASPANAAQADVLTAEVNNAAGRQRVTVGSMNAGGYVQLTVWGSYLDYVRIEDYGGATDKTDCEPEKTPYAWNFLNALRDARGSGYTRERGGLVHVENMALARAHAASWRRAERLACNANPGTALEKAEEWRQVLGVRRRDRDTDATLRTRNAAKMRAALGPTRATVDDAVAELMGPLYVRTWRNYDPTTMADDPGTFWPGVNPGAATRDLGGGAWYSDRQHVVVELVQPAAVGALEWQDKLADLTELLDLMLPATCTFDWVVSADSGFVLDVSRFDEGCLG